MNGRNLTRLGAIAAVALAAAGCGGNTSCPTETPKVQRIQSCTVKPSAPVAIQLELCPTCNQNVTACQVDLSDVGPGSGQIFLDPIAESCGSAADCGTAPACAVGGPSCSFTAPATEGTYLLTTASISGQVVNGQLTVSTSQTPNCAFTTAGL